MPKDNHNFPLQQIFIAKWDFCWSDDFYVTGAAIVTKGEILDVEKMARDLDNPPPVDELWGPVPPPRFYIGTNQEQSFNSYIEMFKEVKTFPVPFYHKVYIDFLEKVVTHEGGCPIYERIQDTFMDYLSEDDDLAYDKPASSL